MRAGVLSEEKLELAVRRILRLSAAVLSCLAAGVVRAAMPISPAHPELLQQQILAAYAAGQPSVVIPAGVYMIPPIGNGNGFHLDLENMNNFEIDARGATFVFQDQTRGGILFYNCTAVLFHGATLYFGTPPFSQGVIRAVAADGSSLDVQIEQGYPTNLDDPKYFTRQIIGHLFDPVTRWWKPNVRGDIYGTQTQRLGPNTFRIFTDDLGGGVAGDLVGWRSGVGDHILRVDACSRMVLTSLTIYNSPGGAVQEDIGSQSGPNQYTNITVKRGPPPAGAITPPLFTTVGGPGSSESRQGPDIENWYMEAMNDDGIAIGGQDSWVMEAHGNTLIVSNTYVGSGYNFLVGDPVRLEDTHDLPAGEAVVTNIIPLPNYHATCKSARQTYTDFTVGPYYQITLDRPVTAGCDYLAGNPAAAGAGYVLRNNTITNHRERGMILQADNGLIENNVISGSTLIGIFIGPESYWGSAVYSRNVTIRDNTISNVGYWAGSNGAIVVATNSQYDLPPAGAFQNIVIDGNSFQNFNVTGIFVSSTNGVVITNNTFRNVQEAISFAEDDKGQDVLPGTLVFVTKSAGVEASNNSGSQLGPYNRTSIETEAGVNILGGPYTMAVAGSNSGFSSTQGANSWSYGYFPAGNWNAFTLLPTYNAQSGWWQHTTFGPPWTLVGADSAFHPNGADSGGEEWATRRWTSTISGAATLSGHLAKTNANPASTGIYGRIYLNHNLVYQQFIAGADGAGVYYSLPLTLKTGDLLDFSVAPNGGVTDDSTIFSSFISIPASGVTAGSGPAIAAVSNAASGQPGAAPGTYLSIYGLNFAPAGFVDDWSKSVIGGVLPTKLDGVSVTIGGKPTYIAAVTSTQINVLTPALPSGAATVTVTTSAGASTPFPISSQSIQPAFFAWPANQAVATHVDFTPAAANGTLGMTTAPGEPGETIILWGTGFGPASPPVPDGQVVPSGIHTVSGVAVNVGGQPATVAGAALSPGLAGVYQIAIQVPAGLADGEYLVIANVSGVYSPIGVLLAVQSQ